MAIYGIGVRINEKNVIDDFFRLEMAGTGWSSADAPDVHEIFRAILPGDIVFLKSCACGSDITVKGIGIIKDLSILNSRYSRKIHIGRSVRWLSHREFRITKPENSRNNVRANTIYQEYHPDVVAEIMDELSANYHLL